MHSLIFTISLFLLFIATSHAWVHVSPLEVRRHDSDIATKCRRIRALTELNDIANNQTALNTMLSENKHAQARIDWLQKHKDEISTKLAALTANATLTAECNLDAQQRVSKACEAFAKMALRLDLIGDSQTIADMLQKDQLRHELEAAGIDLQQSSSDATLMQLCTDNALSQQDGGEIGNMLVDNSGAIGLTKSDAGTYRLVPGAATIRAFVLIVLAMVIFSV
ncbi:hypothetical protein BDW02DRAFT_598216 [Decorospora gaudefroyi]|uniref:Fungal N-terminal domain-containing protein n=1 Tax=Decorospora gaudefroyi TaxID=184978 RepID=A0A6A5KDP0_9PLEO|nr:hypothetical protein BDW02DRAFT_598216 [Decorospora gaudefroyi]